MWTDGQIDPGREWESDIRRNLQSADIIVLLVSPDFLASEYIYDKELKHAMERHETAEVQVIPVFLRPCYWKGEVFGKLQGVPDDAKAVTEWNDLDAAFLNVVEAIYRAAWKLDEKLARREMEERAERGDTSAQYNLGWVYMKGDGVAEDNVKAVWWWRRAAEQGHALTQFNLGRVYERGRGVPKDDAQAVQWYCKAAEQGLAEAQINLGRMYETGRGIVQNNTQAVQWYRKAAEQGSAQGQSNLGTMYQDGRGVTQDDVEAVHWYRKAAEQNFAVAQYNLALMCELGRGVAQDNAQAVHWYRKASEHGLPEARQKLQAMYRRS